MAATRFLVSPVSVSTPLRSMAEACHDIRRPVASMFALATAALAEPGLSEPTRERLEQIVGQVDWLADLIQHSPHITGLDTPCACRTDLSRVVRDAVNAERATWPGMVRMLGEGRPVFTAAHSVLVRRAIANLLSNATRAAGPSGVVSVAVRRNRQLAMVAIEDTGPGFGMIEPGFGLGLVTVSRCVAVYGGRLDRECGADGGVRVSLWLPRTIDAPHHGHTTRQVTAPRSEPDRGPGRQAAAEASTLPDAADAVQRLREACHDMRQPVAGVLALAAAALADPDLPGAVRAYLGQIIQQAERLADMIQDSLQAAWFGESGRPRERY
jgi:signal transduction histidine kinase